MAPRLGGNKTKDMRYEFEFQYIKNGPLDEVGLEDPPPPLPYCFETEVLNKV